MPELSQELRPLYWEDGKVHILDQTGLPHKKQYLVCSEFWQVAEAIRQMRIRGAPLIGIAAGYGFALGLFCSKAKTFSDLMKAIERISTVLQSARPTAVNLFYAVEQMRKASVKEIRKFKEQKEISARELSLLKRKVLELARKMEEEDLQANMTLAAHGAYLIQSGMRVLTICNTGSLATAGYGTALGVIRRAREQGKDIHVYVCETRPSLQGSRLTCFELSHLGIPHTLVVDSSAAYLMQRGIIDFVIAGADRIAHNGDTANKIGTYSLAVLARAHNIPFYIAAPLTTIDPSVKEGKLIPIEERGEEEVKYFAGTLVAPEKTKALNFSFDVTPARLISGIITERGIARFPFTKTISAWLKKK